MTRGGDSTKEVEDGARDVRLKCTERGRFNSYTLLAVKCSGTSTAISWREASRFDRSSLRRRNEMMNRFSDIDTM